MSISKQEQIAALNSQIDQIKEHIIILSQAILEFPNDDVSEKKPRQDVLNDYVLGQKALENELNVIIGGEE